MLCIAVHFPRLCLPLRRARVYAPYFLQILGSLCARGTCCRSTDSTPFTSLREIEKALTRPSGHVVSSRVPFSVVSSKSRLPGGLPRSGKIGKVAESKSWPGGMRQGSPNAGDQKCLAESQREAKTESVEPVPRRAFANWGVELVRNPKERVFRRERLDERTR